MSSDKISDDTPVSANIAALQLHEENIDEALFGDDTPPALVIDTSKSESDRDEAEERDSDCEITAVETNEQVVQKLIAEKQALENSAQVRRGVMGDALTNLIHELIVKGKHPDAAEVEAHFKTVKSEGAERFNEVEKIKALDCKLLQLCKKPN